MTISNGRRFLLWRVIRAHALFLMAVAPVTIGAQDVPLDELGRGFQTSKTYHMDDFDAINLLTGTLTLHIPLLSYSQLGSLPPVEVFIGGSSGALTNLNVTNCNPTEKTTSWERFPTPIVSPAWVIQDVSFTSYSNALSCPPPVTSASYHAINENETHLPLGDLNGSPIVNGLPVMMTSAEGEVQVNTSAPTLTDRRGNVFSLLASLTASSGFPTPAGCAFAPGSGLLCNTVTRVQDVHGNQITHSGGTWTDSIGRQIPDIPTTINAGGETVLYPVTNGCFTLQYPGQASGTVPLTYCVNAALQSVGLPNGTSWSFSGNANAFANAPLTITAPTGATYTYTFTQVPTCGNTIFTTTRDYAVATKTMDPHDGSAAKVWHYFYNTPSTNVTTVTDPDGNDTVHTFSSIGSATPCSLYETKTQVYQGSSTSGGSILKTIDLAYYNAGINLAAVGINQQYGVFPKTRTTTWPSGQVSQETFVYDSSGEGTFGPTNTQIFYGDVVQHNVSDYGSNAPGPVLRQTLFQYQWQGSTNYQAANLLDIPCVVTIYGPGSAPQLSGCTAGPQTNQLAQTITAYDENNGSPQGVFGNPTSVTHWGGTGEVSVTSKTVYNSQGMPTQRIDPNGNSTTITYDSTGLFPSQVQGPDTAGVHHSDKYSYDANTGQLMSHTDQNGQVTSYGYDNMRRITSVAFPVGGGSEFYTYNDTTPSPSFTFKKAITSSLNFVETGIVDGLGRPVTTQTTVPSTTCSSGTVTVNTTYDNLGRKATVTNPYCTTNDPTYGVTTYQYDALSRLTTLIPPDGTVNANNVFTDYSQFPTITVTDEAGKQRRSRTDALGRLVEVDEPSASGLGSPWTTLYTYDGLGNLTCVEQHGDATTGTGCSAPPSSDFTSPWRVRRFNYDGLSRLVSSYNPETNVTETRTTGTGTTFLEFYSSYSYDANGNLLQKASLPPNHPRIGTLFQTISYCYDALNRVTGKAYSVQSCTNGQLPAGTAVVSYTYDQGANGIGHLTSLTDQVGSGIYGYDTLGRIASEQRVINSLPPKNMSYEYNLDGSISKLHYPSGAVITYTPDSTGRDVSAVDSGNSINYATSATYNPTGALSSFVSGNTGSFSGITNSFSFNNRLQPVSMSATSPSATLFSLNYDFHLSNGNNGNVFGITNNKDTTRNQTFTYDQVNRLISAQNAGTDCSVLLPDSNTKFWGNTYTFDAWGNLLAKNITKCGSEFLSVSVGVNNQLVGFGYDAAGNMISAPTPSGTTATSTYDAENRLIASNFGVSTTYAYDADGNRVEKSSSAGGTLYWYMTPGVVAESDLAGNLQSEYVFFNGTRVARKDFTGNAVSYYFADHLKTTDIVTDAQGNILNESDFYPWGGELHFSVNDSNHYKFTGKERDDNETGLDYFGARYYSQALSRFITADPLPWVRWQRGKRDEQKEFDAYIANPQNFNMYAYVRNNPLNQTDPTGMNACGTNDDSTCKVVITFTSRTTDENGNYNDQFKDIKGQENYNAQATVTVNGVVIGTFLARTTPSDSDEFATVQNGTYDASLTTHNGKLALLLKPTNNIPVVGGKDPATGANHAEGILVHSSGKISESHPLGFTETFMRHGVEHGVSEGCQLICNSAYSLFQGLTGMKPYDGPPQKAYTVIINTNENDPNQ